MAADVSYSHLRQWCADGAGTHSHAASTLEMADVESHRLTNRAGWWRSALVPQTVPQDWGTPQARESTRCTDGWKTCRPGTCSHLSSHLAANDTVEVSGSSPATPTTNLQLAEVCRPARDDQSVRVPQTVPRSVTHT